MRNLTFVLALGVWCLISGPVAAQFASECDSPGTPIDSTLPPAVSGIEITEDMVIGDTHALVNITHTFQGDLDVDLESPSAIIVRLHDQGGGGADNIFVNYNDQGVANGTEPYDCNCDMQPAGNAGVGTMADFNASASMGTWVLTVTDNFGGDIGTLDMWCIDLFDAPPPPPAIPVENLDCNSQSGSGVIDATWTNPITYDSFNIYIDGGFVETIAGSSTSYSSAPLPIPSTVTLGIEGVAGGATSAVVTCSVSLIDAADLEVCSTPGTPIDSTLPPTVDVISIVDDQVINDLQIAMNITHTFQGDLDIDLLSPAATMVRLHDQGGGGADNILLTYWELGVPNGSEPYDFGGLMQPSGPGSLLDIIGLENTLGDWTLTVTDNIGGDVGTLDEWCIRSFLTGPAFPIGNLDCTPISGLGQIDATWTNTSTYDSINVYVNGVLETTLGGTATSYTTLAQPVPSTATLCIEGVAGGVATPQVCCTLDLILDQVQDVACVGNGATGEIDVTWVNPGPYDDINIYVDGALEATINGTETSYTTAAVPGPYPLTVQVCVEGVFMGGIAAQTCCTVLLVDPSDIEECSSPGLAIDSTLPPAVDVINVGTDLLIGDTEILVGITHTFQGDMLIDITSPALTIVTLHDQGGAGDDNINLLWSDAGVANGSLPYNCGCAMQPSGPGVLADFMGQSSAGDWTLSVTDLVGGDVGTLDTWCVRIFEGCPVAPPTDLECSNAGANVDLTWSNAVAYDSVEILRDGVMIDSVAGTATSYTDTGATPGSHTWRVRGVDNAQMCGNLSNECSLVFGALDPICSDTVPVPIPDGDPLGITNLISATATGALTDLQVSVQISHTFQGDLTIDISSPTFTVVRLHDQGGGGADNLDVLFSDSGIGNGTLPFDCACEMQPSGPGTMADFAGQEFSGDWSLTVADNIAADTGTLDAWCLIAFGPTGGGGPVDDFIRGDCDGDGVFNGLIDGLRALNFQFVPGTPAPPCLRSCDFDANNVFNGLVDGLGHLNFQFVPGSPPPAAPFPGCGGDAMSTITCDTPPAACNP